MKENRKILVYKNLNDSPYYLLLNRDPEAKNWDLPSITEEEDVESFLCSKLGIKRCSPADAADNDVEMVKVPEDEDPVINTESHAGGVFLNRKEARQLIDSKTNLKAIEKHSA